ncbi:hypothetical protein PISMIDRAFT_18510 [Pisolithus microcarpus 441]|uniref:Uncharacterized protein n=1 Tax=Pisolithus microcarpus 441 TaxID=765257 RepID=A0A0C9Y731_9AGAM|nr:hypothetical protein BKA83DRAFT_18510 [Pisolithus microcarpus]KIK12756.1 hypothetical protein PISMIDRAFT_18510 [Pisolithus microcarpus 441]
MPYLETTIALCYATMYGAYQFLSNCVVSVHAHMHHVTGVGDLLAGIYTFFQAQVTRAEVIGQLDRVLNAIRDIYKNELLHGDIRDEHRQARPRSGMPHSPILTPAVVLVATSLSPGLGPIPVPRCRTMLTFRDRLHPLRSG